MTVTHQRVVSQIKMSKSLVESNTKCRISLCCNSFSHASVENNLRPADSKSVSKHWVADAVNGTRLGFQTVLQNMDRRCFRQ